MRRGCVVSTTPPFVDCVRSGEPFWTWAADQLETMRRLEDAYRLAETPVARS